MSQQTMPPPLRYAPPDLRDAAPFPMTFALLLGMAALLSLPSALVVLIGANDEPYFGTIRKSDAFVQVGVGTTLIFLWLAWAVALVVLLFLRRVPWAALALLILPLLAAFYLAVGVDGYVDDLIRAQAMDKAAPAASAR